MGAESDEPSEQAAKEAAQAAAESASASSGEGQQTSSEASAIPEKPEEVTPEQLKELKEKAAKADEYRDELLRQRAEYENLRKRTTREREQAVKYANEAILEKLLPIIDNFEMALKAAENKETATVENLKTGVSMIYTQLSNLLQENGLEEVDANGKTFDPQFHEALSQEESHEVPEGQVLYQVRKGYQLRDRLLRPSSVVVAKAPETKGSSGEQGQSGTEADQVGSGSQQAEDGGARETNS